MNSCTRTSLVAIMVTGLVMLASAGSAATPEGVSPGAVDRVATIRGECPTFSWGAVAGATFYELVVFDLPEGYEPAAELELSVEHEVLYTRVGGGASSWTPESERCFVPGGSYVWFVRAMFDEEGVLEAGEWSQGLFFSVAAAPSAEQVEQALDVLRRFVEQGGGEANELGALLSDSSESPTLTPMGRTPPGKLGGRTLPGSAAIKGEMPDPTGETYGVYGVTNSTTDGSIGVVGEATAESGQIYGIGGLSSSPDGAGVVAFNAADGPDLLLASGAYSAALTEAGLDRNRPIPVTFNFQNSSPTGTMTLQVDGVEVVTTLTDQDTLGGLSCVHDQIAKWNTVLSQWECSDDVDTDTDTLGGLACGPSQIPKWSGTFWFCSPDDDTTYSAGNQLDLAGATFNVVEGSGSGLDADTLDSHNTDYFATAGHGHFGETWLGSATDGLKVENTSTGTRFAIKGWATGATGGTYGVFGKSTSDEGTGVWGWADAATGETYGVSGLSSSDSGRGVHGETSSATGTTYGVYGKTNSAEGFGGYFENAGGGVDIMADGSGDVAQIREGNGLVKAAVYVQCFSSPNIPRSFNNVPDAPPISITWEATGMCAIDFGFNLYDRFWSATAGFGDTNVSCSNHLVEPNILNCRGGFPGSYESYDAVIVVY